MKMAIPEPGHFTAKQRERRLDGCRRCGLCCVLFAISKCSRADRDRLGPEFFVEREDGGIELRSAPRSFVPSEVGGTACVFLEFDGERARCAVNEEKPGLCARWSCGKPQAAALIDWALANRLGRLSAEAERTHDLTCRWIDAWEEDRRSRTPARHERERQLCADLWESYRALPGHPEHAEGRA